MDKVQIHGLVEEAFVISKEAFDGLREVRKRNLAGSGFSEWGKHFDTANDTPVNEGIYCNPSLVSTMRMGAESSSSSRTGFPIIVVDGVQHTISNVANSTNSRSDIKYPDAPDGTKTYNSTTGAVTQHVDAAAAFLAETATNKVIVSRKDVVLIETWHEAISTHDIVVPLGNVQYAGTYEDVPLFDLDTYVEQQYCAFGKWDTTTVGRGNRWSRLTEAGKKVYLDDTRNNMYTDTETGELIQVRYRIRVIEGLGDDWEHVAPNVDVALGYTISPNVGLVKVRGNNTTFVDYYDQTGAVYYGQGRATGDKPSEISMFSAGISDGIYPEQSPAHNGIANCIMVAQVQRLNRGAYHPTWNPLGCALVDNIADDNHGFWYESTVNKLHSTSDAFVKRSKIASSGAIGGVSGRPDQYDYYDAIYAGLVEDLRLNANKQDVNKLLEDSIHKAVRGETRGKGKVTFSQFTTATCSALGIGNIGVLPTADNPYVAIDTNAFSRSDGDSWTFGRDTQFWMYNHTKGAMARCQALSYSQSDGRTVIYQEGTWLRRGEPRLDNSTIVQSGDTISLVIYEELGNAEFDSLPWVDVIGDPERIAATFPDGIAGKWIPRLPTGSSVQFALTNKSASSSTNYFWTSNSGGTWGAASTALDTTSNTFTDITNVSTVLLLCYETLSDFTESSLNSAVLGSVGDVYQLGWNGITSGNRLMPSLTGRICTNNVSSYDVHSRKKTLSYGITPTGADVGKLQTNSQYRPTHSPITLGTPNNETAGGFSAAKSLYTITEKDGLLYMQYHGRGLLYSSSGTAGNRWGDTVAGTDYINAHGVIPIIDNEGVDTDLNGNTVKTFCHHEMIPIGIANNNNTNS